MTIIKLTKRDYPFVFITWGPQICFSPRPFGSAIFELGSNVEMEVMETTEEILAKLREASPYTGEEKNADSKS